MAKDKPQGKPAATKAEYGVQTPAPQGDEAVNGEQLEALERTREAQAQESPVRAPGPDVGELEERTVEAENRADAAERKNAELGAELQILKEQIAALMRGARTPQQRPDSPAEAASYQADGDEPRFEETEPHGIVVGDTEVAFVQDGHQFGRDRRYLRTEKHRGVPRAFNPRLVGWVKPRPNQTAVDALDGFRDS